MGRGFGWWLEGEGERGGTLVTLVSLASRVGVVRVSNGRTIDVRICRQDCMIPSTYFVRRCKSTISMHLVGTYFAFQNDHDCHQATSNSSLFVIQSQSLFSIVEMTRLVRDRSKALHFDEYHQECTHNTNPVNAVERSLNDNDQTLPAPTLTLILIITSPDFHA